MFLDIFLPYYFHIHFSYYTIFIFNVEATRLVQKY